MGSADSFFQCFMGGLLVAVTCVHGNGWKWPIDNNGSAIAISASDHVQCCNNVILRNFQSAFPKFTNMQYCVTLTFAISIHCHRAKRRKIFFFLLSNRVSRFTFSEFSFDIFLRVSFLSFVHANKLVECGCSPDYTDYTAEAETISQNG